MNMATQTHKSLNPTQQEIVERLKGIEFQPQELCIWFEALRAWADYDESQFLKAIVDCTTIITQNGLVARAYSLRLKAKGDSAAILRATKQINEHLGVIDKGYIALAIEKARPVAA